MRSGCPVEASLTTLDLTQLNHISGTINTDHPSAHCGQLKTEDAEAAAHVQRQAVTSGVSIQVLASRSLTSGAREGLCVEVSVVRRIRWCHDVGCAGDRQSVEARAETC